MKTFKQMDFANRKSLKLVMERVKKNKYSTAQLEKMNKMLDRMLKTVKNINKSLDKK